MANLNLTLLSPRKSLNKAYLKVKPSRSEIEIFKTNLVRLLDGLDESESEEHVKNDLNDFLRSTFYQKFYINTKGRNDLVIHNGPDAKSLAGVLLEAKKPSNKTEMIRPDNLNAKAFQELILYYLRERITNRNLEIKHLVATNIYEWFVFDAGLFEKTFAQDKKLVQQFNDFEEGRLAGKTTDFFYKEIAEPFMEGLTGEISFSWFDFREYENPLRNADKKDDAKLIALFKLLSPEHLLKLPFQNDSNSLDKTFYTELLHIIGLAETKEGSKKLIGRKKEGQRDPGSLIENTILQLDTRDKISRLSRPALFGETNAERIFNVSLELVITWLNRILFLKLLEAQLVRYHKSDPEYRFMNTGRIDGYDDLDNLFFRVLARKTEERDPEMAKSFSKIPYLNSSLFEPTELEQLTIFISNLQDHSLLPIISSTVLKDNIGKKRTGNLSGLQYLFEFLDAYDFAGEGSEEIQEENKTLINASVLGLIFEKINGYKDGSFFTPGFITMYMCRETIRRAVVQKFNDTKGWNCDTIDQLYDKIEDRQEANKIINSLKICDPAVGSGHFLVSALNEIIAIKSDLKILTDREGRRLKEYRVDVANDELIVTDEEGDFFEYMPGNNESQRIQEALFHEKQTIIENCLFGVDINQNSVKICRLRLWIELLKNAYYKVNSPTHQFTNSPVELETLPNIDINIKCGNSLISRYSLDADIKQALKKSKWSIDSYRLAVMSYRNATSKEEKRTMERLIESIKTDFETEVAANDKRLINLHKLQGELFTLTNQTSLFERTKKELADWNKKIQHLASSIQHLEAELESIKTNKIYENAFEWRFEFPEVLNDEGDFVGFDVVIGNPPYGLFSSNLKNETPFYEQHFVTNYKIDIYHLFFQKGVEILSKNSLLSFITPSTWLTQKFTEPLRKTIIENYSVSRIALLKQFVFEEANVNTSITFISKTLPKNETIEIFRIDNDFTNLVVDELNLTAINSSNQFAIDARLTGPTGTLIKKLKEENPSLDQIAKASLGCQAYNSLKHSKEDIQNRAFHSDKKLSEEYLPELAGNDVGRYFINRIKGKWIKYGPWLHDYRTIDWLEGPRILIREIAGKNAYKIQAVYVEEIFCHYKTILNVNPREGSDISMKYLCGLLNSKLLSFLFVSTSNKIESDLFPRISVGDIRQLPIKLISPNSLSEKHKEERIVNLVNTVQISKKVDKSTDTSIFEDEIDRLVYELYGLTEEEIKIVEGEGKI